MLVWLFSCISAPVEGPSAAKDGSDPAVRHEVVTYDGSEPPVEPDTGDGTTGTPPADDSPPPEDTAPDNVEDTAGEDVPEEPNDPCAAAASRLGIGDDHDVEIDDYTGDGETTEPKTDANDGADGDNPEFQRYNVARGHCSGTSCYWYTSSHQESGEPDPRGEQWVEYRPDFADLGVGWYQITARYRQTENRAGYAAEYVVSHRDGDTLTEIDQRDGTDDMSFDLGLYWMCPGSAVRVEDPGSDSITFNEMTFTWLGG